MTLGQRIQELRKQRGMSQEALGDALGVSRQAVSKWEGDNGIPELDTLIAISRLFDITVGQLLGVEEASGQTREAPGTADEVLVESVLRRYAEQTAKKEKRSWFARWGRTVSEAIVVTTVFVVLFAQLFSLRSTVKLLRYDLANLQVTVSNNQNNLPGQIRNTIHDVLAEDAELLSTFQWKLADVDFASQTATLRLEATMKEYIADSKLQFCANWQKVDDTQGQTTGDWVDGPNFQSQITLPFNYNTEISIRVKDPGGNIKEQLLQTPIYELHPENFCLYARNLTAPFVITRKTPYASDSTSKGEGAYVNLESVFPDFVWPEKAVLAAYVNDVEVMRETMTIVPSGREKQVFHASLPGTHYDLELKNGDTLDVLLTVTDNLGRTEQFTSSVGVQGGQLQRELEETPVISVVG